VTLGRRRVYILPSRFGIAFAGLIFAMLLGSLNYAASLGFALTFLLGGLGLVMMHHCHNNLLGTTVRFAGAAPVFVGDQAQFHIALHNDARASRFDIALHRNNDRTDAVDLSPGHSRTLTLNLPALRRGQLALGRFGVTTNYPGNLFHAWSWIHMHADCLVYPRPAPPGRPMPVGGGAHGAHGINTADDADFVGLRSASPSDPPRRLAWKIFARTDQLMAKQFAGTSADPCLFDWDSLPDLDREARLSQLTRWCLDAADEMRSFGIRLPQRTIALGSGDRHLHECLSALALFEI
jgi:uncharacterized protein (DUF58 family)